MRPALYWVVKKRDFGTDWYYSGTGTVWRLDRCHARKFVLRQLAVEWAKLVDGRIVRIVAASARKAGVRE